MGRKFLRGFYNQHPTLPINMVHRCCSMALESYPEAHIEDLLSNLTLLGDETFQCWSH